MFATRNLVAFAQRSFSTTVRKSTPLMHSCVVMTSGPDDKDVFSIITSELGNLNANIEESRSTSLGGDFSSIILVTLPNTIRPEDISSKISSVLPDFTIAARITSANPAVTTSEPSKVLSLDIEGPDQPNIVASISRILYNHGVSVKDIITDTSSAPFLGYNVFAYKSIISVPLRCDMTRLEQDLQEFEEKFGLAVAVSDPSDRGAEDEGQYEEDEEAQQ